jgi:hypothetical protein
LAKKYPFPRSKIRARPDVKSLQATIPENVVKNAHIRAGDTLQWIHHPADGDYIRIDFLR